MHACAVKAVGILRIPLCQVTKGPIVSMWKWRVIVHLYNQVWHNNMFWFTRLMNLSNCFKSMKQIFDGIIDILCIPSLTFLWGVGTYREPSLLSTVTLRTRAMHDYCHSSALPYEVPHSHCTCSLACALAFATIEHGTPDVIREKEIKPAIIIILTWLVS